MEICYSSDYQLELFVAQDNYSCLYFHHVELDTCEIHAFNIQLMNIIVVSDIVLLFSTVFVGSAERAPAVSKYAA